MLEEKFVERISKELSVRSQQAIKAIELLDGGATIPFIARYRKDVTGNLDEVQLEAIAERNTYFTALTQRRTSVLEAIEKQGKLTDELRAAIEGCSDKTTLEDLYLPYKKARRTKATVAREKDLEPLANFLMMQALPAETIEEFAAKFVSAEKSVSSAEEALEGAGFILAEKISLDAETRALMRDVLIKQGKIAAQPTKNSEGKKTKFETYYDFSEAVEKIPSHRMLAILRGAKEGILRTELSVDDDKTMTDIGDRLVKEKGSPFEPYIRDAVKDAYNRLLRPSLENEVVNLIRDRAGEEAIRVFRENAHNLLLSAPAGQIAVVGIDPGLKTGCKIAVVDQTGAFLESATIFPTPPKNDTDGAEKVLLALMDKHNAKAIAIGNGTGSREVNAFVRGVLTKLDGKGAFCVFVNESGASIYSASKIAREEFPKLDVTIRGAISIARRLQDPLAELVKIDPRHIGVGQYQHDVNQKQLRDGLNHTVVSCVNKVGVDLNTASSALLRYVSGVQAGVAKKIVEDRTKRGGFSSRTQLLEVDGVGPKVFEQCAGFLRLANGDVPLDNTGIHPEAYPIVEKMAETAKVSLAELLEKPKVIAEIDLSQFVTEVIGQHTLEDIRNELVKPGRDPRTEFRAPKFLDGVNSVAELEEGMTSEGVVTNVTDFGAFVDIGVHQDGLVHLSELANRFVQDPRDVVKVGDIVNVKVLKVDKELPRISLSMKALLPARKPAGGQRRPKVPQDRAAQPAGERDRKPRAEGDRGPGDRQRSRRPRTDRGGKRDDNRGAGRPGRGGRGKPQSDRPRQSGGDSTPLSNTQLADQLAALKKKLGS